MTVSIGRQFKRFFSLTCAFIAIPIEFTLAFQWKSFWAKYSKLQRVGRALQSEGLG